VRVIAFLWPLALGAAVLTLSGCGEREEPTGQLPATFPVTVQGAGDAPLSIASAPGRIVALDSGSAELVDALGAGTSLVGVPTGASLGPGLSPVEVVHEGGEIDVDAVVELEPDLVVVTPETDRIDVAQVDRRTGAPVYVQPALTVEDVVRAVLDLGYLLGRPVEARQLAGQIEQDAAETEQRLAAADPVTVFVDTGLFVTIRDDSIFGDLLRKAHAENVAPDPGLGPISATELAAQDPDFYIVTSDSDLTLDSLRRNPETSGLRAVQEGRVLVLPVELVARAGPRVAEALETIAVALHPDAFR
jgi:iron complex transport system substrate-binding protein